MATNFTFKKEPRETGLASIGAGDPNTLIKLEKKEVGYISGPNWQSKDNLWRIRLMKIDKEEKHCGWKWVTLAAKFDDEPSARVYLKENFERICALGLRQADDD
jgi:hypothetical protein